MALKIRDTKREGLVNSIDRFISIVNKLTICMEKAIAWALGRRTNLESKESDRMLPEEADIEAHIKWLESNEAVYFDHTWHCRIEGPINGYLYVPELEAIAYKLKIDEIISSRELLTLKNRIELKYVPPWREQCFKGKWPNSDPYTPGEFHKPSPTWIKVSKICKLSPLIHDSRKIIKWTDKEPLESFIPPLRSRVYIVDRNWKCEKI